MHVSQVCITVPALARQDRSAIERAFPGLGAEAGTGLIRDIWNLSDMTVSLVRSDGERDLRVLADRIEARMIEFLDETPPEKDEPVPWLVDGTTAPVTLLTCHLLNEMVVHGYDIARAAGLRWTIPRNHARMVLEGFVIPLVSRLDPAAMVDQEKAGGVELTYELRIRGGGRYHFVFKDGSVVISGASALPVDCRISADPTALLLTLWGRESLLRAAARGRMFAWGRKPWAGPKLRSLLRNP